MKMFDITKYIEHSYINDCQGFNSYQFYVCPKTLAINFYNKFMVIIKNEALIDLFHTSPYRTIKIITESDDSYLYRFDEVFHWNKNTLEVTFNTRIKECFMELTEEEMFYLTLKEDFYDN